MPRGDRRRTAPIRWGLIALAAFVSLAAAPLAFAQGETVYIPLDFKTIGLQGLASFDPALLYRPIDMLSTRPGGGAAGMSGAYTATASGVMALGWNPAGLATLDRPSATVDGLSIGATGLVGDYPDSFLVPQSPPLLITSYDVNLKGGFHANYLAFGAPIMERGALRMVGGLAWRRFMNLAYPEETIGEFSFSALAGFPVILSFDRSEKGSVDAFTPGVACQFGSKIAVGASFNILDGTWRATSDNRLTVVGPPYRGQADAKIRYSGMVPELGIRLTPTEKVQLAAKFMPGFDLKARDGSYYAVSIPYPTRPVTIISAQIADYDLAVPSALALGLAIRPIPRLLFAVDLNSQKWSQAEAKYKVPVTEIFPQQNEKLPLTDVESIAFGSEYLLKDAGWAQFPIRAGFRSAPQGFRQVATADITTGTVPSPYGDIDMAAHNGTFNGKEVSGTSYSFGFSMVTPGVRYDLGVESVKYSFDKWLFDSPYDELSNPRGVKIKTDRSVHTLRLTASYDF